MPPELYYVRFVPLRRLLALTPVVLAGLACGTSAPGPATAPTAPVVMMSCPAPIGAVPREDCGEIADDFGALTVSGSLQVAGQGKDAGPRLDAIKAVSTLAESIRDQRVKLCEAYVKCKVAATEHDAQDQLLAGAMRSLIDLWNKRRFAGMDEVIRFREAVRAIDRRVNGGAEGAAAPPRPPRTFKAEEALTRIEDPGVAFRLATGAVTVTATADGKREALRSNGEVVSLLGGHRYRLKVVGRYAPATAPLIQPGDELVARLKYRATQAADLQIALRSLEDPEAAETTDAWHVAAGDKGTRESKLVADPQQTGFYLGVSVRGAPVDLDDLELVRGGKILGAARGEGGDEPGVKTDCALEGKKAIAGTKSLHCKAGEGDRITLGKPEGYLMVGLRDAGGERAAVRMLSLQGGRSVDAAMKEDGGLVVITLVGAGSATIEQLEVTDLGGG
jgi:hypothetical protein